MMPMLEKVEEIMGTKPYKAEMNGDYYSKKQSGEGRNEGN
ncbi:MAG: hypothetical protein DDT29_01521 [Dehalococcoidia bacterium]|nr:hypothetical protein [Bacillota bacterium]